MADKTTPLILTALSQAAAAPDGLPLHGTKAVPGLFPATAVGKQAAQRCLDEGHLRLITPEPTPPPADAGTATAVKKKVRAGQDPAQLTDKGMAYLLGQVSPRQVLEDFVRALEARQSRVEELLDLGRALCDNLTGLRANADRVLQHVRHAESPREPAPNLNALFNGFRQDAHAAPADLSAELLGLLTGWQPSSAAEDCPLPELFRLAAGAVHGTTIGQFHDALRRLHDGGQIFLHPWTGPLYDIPEPPYALLVGHEVAYYASVRM